MQSLLRKIVACLAVIFLAIWYAKTHFYRDPGSAFFDRTRAYEQTYSRFRKTEVLHFIEEGTAQHLDGSAVISEHPSLCVAFSSVRRQHEQYLETTIGSMLHGLTQGEKADLHVAVLIAQTEPQTHPAWQSTWLRHAVDELFTYNISAEDKAHLAQLEQTGAYAEKGIFDYTYAMQRCYDSGTPFVGMFEDDILMADGWLVRTLLGLRQIPAVDDWLFMRLFNQERSTGWENTYIGGNKEHWIILGVGLVISTIAAVVRRRWWWARKNVDIESTCVLVLLLIPALVILFFQSGKASMLPPSPGVFDEPYGCCSQAMIFPRAQMPKVIDYLRSKRAGQVDLFLDDLAIETGLKRYAMYPVQAQHIGLDSARMTLEKEAQAIWSMAFEDLNPRTLKREHGQMIKDYYGE